MDAISLEVTPRDALGKKVSALRRAGMTPVHLYGKGVASRALQGDTATVARVVSQVGQNIPLYLKVSDTREQDLVFVREVQRHPITNQILHVDFYRGGGDPARAGRGARNPDRRGPRRARPQGHTDAGLYVLAVEALPMDMPERIDVDISRIEELDQDIRVSDIAVDEAITILTDAEELVVRINAPRVAEEPVAAAPVEQAEEPTVEASAPAEESQEEAAD